MRSSRILAAILLLSVPAGAFADAHACIVAWAQPTAIYGVMAISPGTTLLLTDATASALDPD
jgi:hypothetical protein